MSRGRSANAARAASAKADATVAIPVLRVLIVEDSEADAKLVQRALKAGWPDAMFRRVDSESAFLAALRDQKPDLVLCDYYVPEFGGLKALALLRKSGLDAPCVFVSGQVGEEKAVEILKAGAADLVVKDALARLPGSVERALRERDAQRVLAKAQRALAESEARFRSLTKLSADWYWEHDEEQRFTGLSGAYFHAHADRVTSKIGRRRWELPEYAGSEADWARYREVVESRQAFRDFEFGYVVDGVERRVSISGEPVYDASGKFRGYRGVGRDITARRLAEETLQRFRAAVDTSVDLVFIAGINLRVVDVNQSACDATGYSRDTLCGLSVEALLPGFSREELHSGFQAAVQRLQRTDAFETEIRRRDGSTFPVIIHRRGLVAGGSAVVVCVARDVSDTRAMMERLQRRAQQQAAVATLGEVALQSKDIGAVMQRAGQKVARLLGVGFVRVLERLADGKAVVRASHGWPESMRGTIVRDAGDADSVGRTLDSTQGILVGDPGADPGLSASGRQAPGIVSHIGVVIHGHDGPYGVLDAHSTTHREFSDDDRNFVTAIANVLAAAIERSRTDAMLRVHQRALQASVSAVVITDAREPDNPILYVNPAFEKITGYAADEVIGRNCRFLQGADREQLPLESIRRALREERDGHAVLRNYTKGGRLFWNDLHLAPVRDDSGQVTHFVGIQNDITENRRYQEQLEFRATHDDLTGLPNRVLLRDRLSHAIAMAQRGGMKLVVAFMDLDHFKFVNDSVGHGAGDEVLRTIGRRLIACLRESDTVARVGGDEFVVVMMAPDDPEFASRTIERIRRRISEQVEAGGREFQVSCSVGLSVYPEDGEDVESLLKNADVAMYRAKEQGRNAAVYHSREMNERIDERVALEGSLRRAAGRGEFELHYQPRVRLSNNHTVGVEALIRWNHPELGQVPPGRFVALAEEMGIIAAIGEWVLRAAIGQMRRWLDAGRDPLLVAVNVSTRQLSDRSLVDVISGLLREYDVDGRFLELEITESTMMRDPRQTERVLASLHDLGLAIAIDDFGTGYSSLNYLKHFRIDCLKIDQSFVRGLPLDRDDMEITRAIIALGRSLKMRLVAEGIERDEQLAFLQSMGCDEGQGFYFARPMAAEALEQWLDSGGAIAGGGA